MDKFYELVAKMEKENPIEAKEARQWFIDNFYKQPLKDAEQRITELEAENKELKYRQIVLPKITPEMAEYLHPELIEYDINDIPQWTQLAVDAASFFEIKRMSK